MRCFGCAPEGATGAIRDHAKAQTVGVTPNKSLKRRDRTVAARPCALLKLESPILANTEAAPLCFGVIPNSRMFYVIFI